MAMFTRGNIAESLPTRWPPLRGEDASQLMEFAIALPLLVVLVVGIFDFGTAFNLKQELNNAAREGARFASSEPTNDLCFSCTPPPSVEAIRSLVDSYLQASRINDCGLSTVTGGSSSTTSWNWTYQTLSGAAGCPDSLLLKVNRSIALSTTGYGNPNTYVVVTQVSISYPFQWRFAKAITLLVSNANYAGVSHIQTDAWAANMN